MWESPLFLDTLEDPKSFGSATMRALPELALLTLDSSSTTTTAKKPSAAAKSQRTASSRRETAFGYAWPDLAKNVGRRWADYAYHRRSDDEKSLNKGPRSQRSFSSSI